MTFASNMKPSLWFASIFLVLTIWRELVWIRRFAGWKKVTGFVSDFWISDDGPGGPIISYAKGSDEATFEAPYCLSNPQRGDAVDVLHDPDPTSDKAVLLTKRHRWFITILFFSFFVLFSFIAIKNH